MIILWCDGLRIYFRLENNRQEELHLVSCVAEVKLF